MRHDSSCLVHALPRLPLLLGTLLAELGDEVRRLNERIGVFEAQLGASAQRLPACQRLMAIPGIGMLTATALAAAVGDAAE